MEFTEFSAGIDDKDRRLDKIIRKMIPQNNISSLYSALRKGLIKVNDKKQDINYKVVPGDKISIASFLILPEDAPKEEQIIKPINNIKVQTVFSNEYIRIINKPYDISVHGTNGLSEIIENIYKTENHETSLSFKTGPLHRLDRKTTGLLAFSNNSEGAKWFSKAIENKIIKKYYIGLCQGKILQSQKWTNSLIQTENKASSFYTMKVEKNPTKANNLAVTECTPLAYGKYQNSPVTLCQFQIFTGKKHQIRCQAAFNGHPLLGDTAYGGIKIYSNQDFFLHAYCLIFPENNPLKIPSVLKAPISANFNKILRDLLINWNSELII